MEQPLVSTTHPLANVDFSANNEDDEEIIELPDPEEESEEEYVEKVQEIELCS
jgi:hypothetical protein